MKSLKKVTILLLFVAFASQAYSQFGVRGKYNLNTFSDWNEFIDNNTTGNVDKIFSSNMELGVDYWFRLKNYRIEFLPEVLMGLKTSTSFEDQLIDTDFSYFGFNFNSQIYAFDLKGDCDCPTFSKQGPSLNKGFFFNVSPGLLYTTKELSPVGSDPASSSNHLNFKLGLGVGYDIGLSDLFTITPMISYNIAPAMTFNDLALLANTTIEDAVESGLNQIQFQLRFGFRPDYVKSYGRRR